jgi:hypothetical protein
VRLSTVARRARRRRARVRRTAVLPVSPAREALRRSRRGRGTGQRRRRPRDQQQAEGAQRLKAREERVLHRLQRPKPGRGALERHAGIGPHGAERVGERGPRRGVERRGVDERQRVAGSRRKQPLELPLRHDHPPLEDARLEQADDDGRHRHAGLVGDGESRAQAAELEPPLGGRLVEHRRHRAVRARLVE